MLWVKALSPPNLEAPLSCVPGSDSWLSDAWLDNELIQSVLVSPMVESWE